MAIRYEQLFDPAFLSALSHWEIHARRVAGAGRHGERLSADKGAGVEFKDYRPYSAGDDLRAIDWNVYRRLGKVFVRLFEEEQDLPIYLMPDVSSSLFFDEAGAPAIIAGLRCTLALAAIGLSHHDAAGLFPFADELQVVSKPKSGSGQVMFFAQQLARLAAAGPRPSTRLGPSLHRFAHLNLRRGLLVIVSDFFDPAGVEALREALRPIRHRLLFIQLTRPSDAAPVLQGDVRLTDCESGEAVDLTLTPRVLERYRAAYGKFNDDLAALARSRGAQLLKIDVEGDLVAQLSRLFADGGLLV